MIAHLARAESNLENCLDEFDYQHQEKSDCRGKDAGHDLSAKFFIK
jgi:hypothetical protein